MLLEQYPEILTVEQLCEVLGVGANTAYQMLHDGTISAFRIGRRWKIPRESVCKYISQWKTQ